jgi:hypothetical protein
MKQQNWSWGDNEVECSGYILKGKENKYILKELYITQTINSSRQETMNIINLKTGWSSEITIFCLWSNIT